MIIILALLDSQVWTGPRTLSDSHLHADVPLQYPQKLIFIGSHAEEPDMMHPVMDEGSLVGGLPAKLSSCSIQGAGILI